MPFAFMSWSPLTGDFGNHQGKLWACPLQRLHFAKGYLAVLFIVSALSIGGRLRAAISSRLGIEVRQGNHTIGNPDDLTYLAF